MHDAIRAIDLLKAPASPPRLSVPAILRPPLRWHSVSGTWERKPAGVIRYQHDSSAEGGENLSLIGSRSWEDFVFSVKFRLLCSSTKPPEGGVILYFLYRSSRYFYSCHFCQWKQKVEFVKRVGREWSTTAESGIQLDLDTEYRVSLSTDSGVHSCCVDGEEVLKVEDSDFVRGRVGLGVKFCDAEFSWASISFPSENPILA